jgi:hypothetical protein
VRLREGGEDRGGQGAALFPFQGVVVQVGLQPGAEGGLPGEVGRGEVGGGEGEEVGGVGEGDWGLLGLWGAHGVVVGEGWGAVR